MAIEAKASSFAPVEEGKHSGVITRWEQRKTAQGYDYIDFYIKIDGEEVEVRPTFNLSMGKGTKLGLFLESLGVDVAKEMQRAKNGKIEIEGLLNSQKGKHVSFMVLNKETARGTFANVVPNSVKLLK